MIRDGSGKSGRCFCAIFLTWCYFCYRIDSQKKKNASSAMIRVSSARDFSDAWYNRTLYRLLTNIIKHLNHWLLSGSESNISIRHHTSHLPQHNSKFIWFSQMRPDFKLFWWIWWGQLQTPLRESRLKIFSDALASLALMIVTDWLSNRNCRLAISHVWQLFHHRSSLV